MKENRVVHGKHAAHVGAGGTVCRERPREAAWIPRLCGQGGAGHLNRCKVIHCTVFLQEAVGRSYSENHGVGPGTG